MEKETTNNEILETMNEFANNVDKRFDSVEKRLTKIEATMVDKDYLDLKLADLRGDIVVIIRNEDMKVMKLIDILADKNLISEEDKQKITSMGPFPRLYV
jgi:hypothetical protein